MNSIASAALSGTVLLPSREELAARFGGDSSAQMAAVLFLANQERRLDSGQERALQEEQIGKHNEKQLSALRQAAQDHYEAAVAEGVSQVASGSISIAGAAIRFNGSDFMKKYGQRLERCATGASTGATGTGKLLAADATSSAGYAAATATQQEQLADVEERVLDRLRDETADVRELDEKVLDFLQSAQQAKAAAEAAPWAVRG